MPRAPNIRVPGLTSTKGIPGGSQGVLLGRLGAKGPVQLVKGAQLARIVRGATKSKNQGANEAGFTFSVLGAPPTSNHLVGQVSWSKPLTFHNADPNDVVAALSGATGTPSFTMTDMALTVLGHIQFLAPKIGTVSWLSDPYVHPATELMLLFCPNPADATLATITGRVVGYF